MSILSHSRPDTAGASEAFASLLSYTAYLTIGKKIRSNTHCPTSMPDFVNDQA
jgi:hypothetical protein